MYNNEFAQEFEQTLGQEMESGGQSQEFEFNPEYLGELSGESQQEYSGETFEFSGELSENLEMEMAHELLEVSNEQELNQFLGKLISGAGKAIGNFARSPIGKSLGGVLKTVAKKALPIAGGAIGTFFGGPLGGAIGGKLGSLASGLFELEMEGLSPEDQEFETARAYVRFANSAANRAATLQTNRPGLPAPALIRQALGHAAKHHAPGLLRPRNPDGTFRAMGTRPSRAGRFAARPAGPYRRPVPRAYAPTGYAYGYTQAPDATSGYAAPDAANGNGYSQTPDAANGYAAPDNGGAEGGSDYSQAGATGRPLRARHGTWQRRGRTLIIQL